MKFPRIKVIFASRTKFPKLVTSLLTDILSKEMRYSGMKTPKSENMTIHTIQIKLYCPMVLEKKPCKKIQAKRRIHTASTISTTSNIENTENMPYC